jgi:hypothetical protein
VRPLPVIATIREAYDFTFANLGAIIALIWVPMVLVTVGEFFIGQHYLREVNAAMAAGNPNAAGPAALAIFFFWLGKLGLYAMMLTAVTQLALGQRKPGAMFHFSFGALEWRTFRNLFGLVLFLLPGALLLMLGIGSASAGGAVNAIALATVAVLVCAVIYFTVRLASLLLPVVLHEEKQVLVKSWSLTAGNFWQLLGIYVGALLPIYVVTLLVMASIVGSSLPQGETMPTVEQVEAVRSQHLPVLSGLVFFIAPLMIGLIVGASVISWRKLTAKTDIIA